MNLRKSSKACLIIFFSFILLSSPLPAKSQQDPAKPTPPRILSAKDTLRINQVSDPRLSPDGQWVLYTIEARDMEDEDYKSTTHIWKVRVDGEKNMQMTQGEKNCTDPSWFPDGKKFAFLSSRGGVKSDEKEDSKEKDQERGSTQIYLMRTDGGEAWQLTSHKEDIESFQISPDGAKIVFSAKDSLTKEEKRKEQEKDDAIVVDEKFQMSHLWVFDIKTKKTIRLTEGTITVSEMQWSPDSRRIAYVTRPNDKPNDRNISDVWIIDTETKTPVKLSQNPGRDFNPRWSPDGKTIAFASDPHKKENTWHNKLYLIPTAGGEPKVLLKDFDLEFRDPIWSPDGKKIYWSTGEKTTVNLFSVDIQSGKVKRITTPRGRNSRWELSHDGTRWVWVHTPPTWPAEIYTADLDLKNPTQLSDSNSWLREEKVKLGKVETITWKNSDNQDIEGVLTYPVGYNPGKKYPLILNPHGGPTGVRIETFSSHNQFFSGNGFFVLQPNFRGSDNYGQEFVNANRGNWGIGDYDDCMTGVDYCIEKGWADPDRLVCYGWSYGGYMSFWIVTQTDRFKAVSPGAGLSNLYSMYGTNDIPAYLEWFFGTPWDNEEMYEKLSAIRHVKNVKSPVLILHGAEDDRVPISQAGEFYRALCDLGKDVTFVKYPREKHGIREPRHQMDRLRRYLDFFAKHVNLTPISEKEWEEEQKKEK